MSIAMRVIETGGYSQKGLATYTCSACGKFSTWGPSWSWYGSYRDLENGKRIIYACSEECMAEAQRSEGRKGRDA
jgi:hypothetical protein